MLQPLILFVSLLALPILSFAETFTITQFRERAPAEGEFEISGYIAKQYKCPACPSGAVCKPCMKNNILLSESGELLKDYPSTGNYLVIFTEEPEKLLIGKSYILKVEVLKNVTTGYGGHDLRLISAVESGD